MLVSSLWILSASLLIIWSLGDQLIVFSGKEGVSASTNEELGAHDSRSFSLLGGHEPVILCVFLSDKEGTCSKAVECATRSEP